MKKSYVVIVLLAGLGVIGCRTEGGAAHDPTKGPTEEMSPAHATVVDHQYRGLKNVPEWVTMSQSELERLPEFKDSIVFKEVFQSKDLNVAKMMADDFNVGAQLSKYISARIKTKFSGALIGSNDGSDVYFEKIVTSVSDNSIAGVRRHADYWILRRYENKDQGVRDIFEYYVLVRVPQSEIKKAVARAFERTPAATENEKRAREKVRQLLDDEEW